MNNQEIIRKLAERRTEKDLLLSLRYNHISNVNSFNYYNFSDIQVKNDLAKIFAINQIMIECLDIKNPGFKEMIKYEYEKQISEYEIKLKISKD